MGFSEYVKEDYGQSLAVSGVGPGCYLVLPVLGPSTARDTIASLTNFIGGDAWYNVTVRNDTHYFSDVDYYSSKVTAGVDFRAKNFDSIENLEKKFCNFNRNKYSLALSSCTGALHIAYLSLGIKKGDEVIVTGFDLGMNTPGGFGQYVSVPSDWVLKKPENMALRDSMIYGTAGLTAALCYKKLASMKAAPEDGPVLVTGSTGGVGSVAVSLLASEGFEVIACTGKAEQEDYLKRIGATSVVSRQELEEGNAAPMGKEKFGHVLDTVGGSILSNALKSLCYGGSAAICGLVASPKFEATVLPFILRNINLLGVDSVEISLDEKRDAWDQLANEWSLKSLESLASDISL